MHPHVRNFQRAQQLGQFVDVLARNEIGGRALDHGHMGAISGDGRDHGRGGGAGSDDDDLLVLIVEIIWPGLGMDDLSLVVGHAVPGRGIALALAVITLAHPKEIGLEGQGLAGLFPVGGDRPLGLLFRPVSGGDLPAIADMLVDPMLFDHILHIAQDLVGRGDGRADPGLETIAEGEEIAVGANARIGMGRPGAAEGLQRLQNDIGLVGALFLQVAGRADARNPRPDNQNVEGFDLVGRLGLQACSRIHRMSPPGWRSPPLFGGVRRLFFAFPLAVQESRSRRPRL